MENNKLVTAVEWLFLMLNNPNSDQEFSNKLLQKAKQIEKEQITNAWEDGKDSFSTRNAEKYYNETFKK
jgi:hypothetical protein